MSSCQSLPEDSSNSKDPTFTIHQNKKRSIAPKGRHAVNSSTFEDNSPKTVTVSTYLRGKLKHLAPELARSGTGSESEARIITNFSRDLYELGYLAQPLIVTKNKLEYEMKRDGNARIKELSEVDMQGLFFDGKKSKVRLQSGRQHSEETVDYYSIMAWPKKYCGQCSTNGTARDIAASILNFIEEHKIKTENLTIIGGDATATNSGPLGGAFHHLEVFLERPLQRSLCLLHHVELVLRAIFEWYDGKPLAGDKYRGPIGQLVQTDVWKLPVGKFKKIENNFPKLSKDVFNKMSRDRQILYKLIIGIELGDISSVAKNTIGKAHQARWITLSSRILRLYCSVPKQLGAYKMEVLERLSIFIIKVYFKMFFTIKYKNSVVDGAKLLFEEIELVREHCTEDEKKVAFKSIQNNAWFAHPENILLSMCGDDKVEVRQLGVKHLKRLRISKAYDLMLEKQRRALKEIPKKKNIRLFHLPALNFKAKNYWEMALFKEEVVNGPFTPPKQMVFKTYTLNYKGPPVWYPVTEPPLLSSLERLDDLVKSPVKSIFPAHTQQVEHAVATTARAVKRRRTKETQLMASLSTVAAREQTPGRVTHKSLREKFLKRTDERN